MDDAFRELCRRLGWGVEPRGTWPPTGTRYVWTASDDAMFAWEYDVWLASGGPERSA